MRPAFVFQRSAASEQRRIFGGTLARPTLFDPRHIPVLPVPHGLRLQAVHAGDVARAFSAAVHRPVTGAFNLAGDGVLRREELGALLDARTVDVPVGAVHAALAAAWRARLAPVPAELFDALLHVPVMSSDRAHEELEWQPAAQWRGRAGGPVLGGADAGRQHHAAAAALTAAPAGGASRSAGVQLDQSGPHGQQRRSDPVP